MWVGRYKKQTERGRRTNSRNPVFDQTLEFILDADTALDPGTMIHLEIHDINWLFPQDFKVRRMGAQRPGVPPDRR